MKLYDNSIISILSKRRTYMKSENFEKPFDRTLSMYPYKKFHVKLIPGARVKHARPYPIPVIHLEAFKKELLHLVDKGVSSAQGASVWAPPTFITLKKMAEYIGSMTSVNSTR
jgi:hypothetical protein